MEAIINNLDYDALKPIWKTTFPNKSIDEYIDTLEYILIEMKYWMMSVVLSLRSSED